MKKFSYQLTSALNPHSNASWHALPAYLNMHSLTVGEFNEVKLRYQPQVVLDLLRQCYPRYEAQLRRMKLQKAKSGTEYVVGLARILGIQEVVVVNKIRTLAERVVKAAEVYQDGDTVVSSIKGAFSYDDHEEYMAAIEESTEIQCPSCRAHETVWDSAPIYELSNNFEQVSGPYYRCSNCEKVVRPEKNTAQEPAGDMSWSEGTYADYVEHLQDVVQDLGKSLEVKGLPEPDYLRVEIGNANWQGRDAYTECDFDGDALASVMQVNGDFSITGGTLNVPARGVGFLSCGLNHHDANSTVTVWPQWECDRNFERVAGDDIYQAMQFAEVANVFQPDPHHPFTVVSHEGLQDLIDELIRDTDDTPI